MSMLITLVRSMLMVPDCRDSNQDKIDAAIQKYWDACNYPRKKKKQMRKEAQKEYNFYLSLQETLDFYG